MRDLAAALVALLLLVAAASLATTLQMYRRRRRRMRDSERALGRTIVAEIPAGDDLVLFSEDAVRFYYGERSIDKDLMDDWGKRGLELAAGNLDKLVGLCREWQCKVTLVVYPWPDNVMAHDRDSIQVRYWRKWAARHDVRFIDAFD